MDQRNIGRQFHKFFSHYSQAVSISKVNTINNNVDQIISGGCWKNSKNLSIFYNKDITEYVSDKIEFNCIVNNLTYFI